MIEKYPWIQGSESTTIEYVLGEGRRDIRARVIPFRPVQIGNEKLVEIQSGQASRSTVIRLDDDTIALDAVQDAIRLAASTEGVPFDPSRLVHLNARTSRQSYEWLPIALMISEAAAVWVFFLLLAAGVWKVACAGVYLDRAWTKRCTSCGYQLDAEMSTCPECGAAVPLRRV